MAVLLFNPGERPYTYTSGGTYVASGVISATGPSVLYDFAGYNSKGFAQFILFFDSATVPADANTGAVLVITVGATSNFNSAGFLPAIGKVFTNGISWANSSTAPAKTIGLTDCYVSADFMK